jgi:hypothetical protein
VRFARSLRRAAKASAGALAGALACAGIAAGIADGSHAALVGVASPGLAPLLLVAAVAALVVAAVARRLQFEPPSARAQRVSFWLAVAGDLADIEVSLALVAGVSTAIAVTGGGVSPL